MILNEIATAARHHWWLFLLRGFLAIAFGALVVMMPGATVVALMAFVAAYAFVDGIVTIVSAVRLRSLFARWWVLLLQGLISAAFGVLAFMRPGLSLLYIVISVSLWMLLASIAQFMLARAQQHMGASPVWSTIGGILSLVLAVVAVAYPGLTVLSVVALIGWFALVVGAVQVVVAFRVRSFAGALARA
jgi:uncharacterized membrane protein HdeD (DUF308 family)